MVKTAPLISFILPYYNVPLWMVENCVRSILSLQLDNNEMEIIVVDDGSNDNIADTLQALDPTLIYLRQNNKGLSGARNTALDKAQGTFVQFVDSDDALIPSAYDAVVSLLRQKTETDVVTFAFSFNESETSANASFKQYESGIELMLKGILPNSACRYVFRRTLLNGQRFYPGIFHEDEEFTPQLFLKAKNIVCTHLKAYYYRSREDSITHTQNSQTIEKRLNDTAFVIRRLNTIGRQQDTTAAKAMSRKVGLLCLEYLYNTISLTHSPECLTQAISSLRKEGLFPIKNVSLPFKYRVLHFFLKKAWLHNGLFSIIK